MRRKNGMQIRIPQAKFAQIRDLMDTAERHAKEDGYEDKAGIILDKRFFERYSTAKEGYDKKEEAKPIKVLVATRKTQGQRANDFCFVPEGEIVTFAFECDDEGPDGSCGCMRSMSGMLARKGTTTMEVQERQITQDELQAMIIKHLQEGGWGKIIGKNLAWTAKSDARELIRIAGQFTPGTIIEKRGNVFQERKPVIHGTLSDRGR